MIQFDPSTHTYTLNGVVVPSVTQILRECGIIDTSRYAPGSAERGTAVHLACQLHDENDLDEASLDPQIVPYLEGWRRFIKECAFEPQSIEQIVVSGTYGYAGTLDRTGLLYGRPAILDIKSGSPEPWASLQLAGYAEALGEPNRRRLAVHLPGDGTYRLHEYRDPSDRRVFLSAVAVCQWKNLKLKGNA